VQCLICTWKVRPTQNSLYYTSSSVSLRQSVMINDPKITHLKYALLVMVTTNFCTLSLTSKGKGKSPPRTGHDGGRRLTPYSSHFAPQGREPSIHCIGGWVGPRVSLDGCRKSRPYQDSILDHPTSSESLYVYCDAHWLMTVLLQKGINAARSEVLTAVLMKFRSTAVSHRNEFKQLPILKQHAASIFRVW